MGLQGQAFAVSFWGTRIALVVEAVDWTGVTMTGALTNLSLDKMDSSLTKQKVGEPHFVEEEGFDFQKTLRTLRAGWRTIAVIGGACFLAGVCYLHIVTPVYTATVMLSATQSQSQGVSGNISELASMAGVSIGKGQSSSPFVLFPYTMNSRPVAQDIIRRSPEFMSIIFRNQWDATTGQWREPGGIHVIFRAVKSILGFPNRDWKAPSDGELQDYIKEHVDAEVSTQKPVVTLTFRHENQAFASHFLQAVYESTDGILRRMALDRSSKYARYLQDQLQTAQLAELRQVMMQSLNEQETIVMMGNSDAPFAAQPIGSAVSSIQPTFPNVPIVLLLAAIMGLVLGCAAALSNVKILQFPFRPINKRTREAFPGAPKTASPSTGSGRMQR